MNNRLYLEKPVKMRVAIDGGSIQEIEAKVKELREVASKYNCDIHIDATVIDNLKSYKELIIED